MSVFYKENGTGLIKVLDDDYKCIMPKDTPRCCYCEKDIEPDDYYWDDNGDLYCEDCTSHFLSATRKEMDYMLL